MTNIGAAFTTTIVRKDNRPITEEELSELRERLIAATMHALGGGPYLAMMTGLNPIPWGAPDTKETT